MKITKGKWDIWQNSNESYAIIVNDFYKGEMLEKNDAILVVDSGNTYQETNKLPSELAKANKELLEAIQLLLKSHRQLSFNENHNLNDTPLEVKISDLIKKHTNHA